MQKQLLSKALVAIVPMVLGFLGGTLSAFYPAHFNALCAGAF
ncbi:hypothetical protein [Pseudogemmobacter bohemicus]|nr:hypothetical protein [Pseudogemmobacter bohemicus]